MLATRKRLENIRSPQTLKLTPIGVYSLPSQFGKSGIGKSTGSWKFIDTREPKGRKTQPTKSRDSPKPRK